MNSNKEISTPAALFLGPELSLVPTVNIGTAIVPHFGKVPSF